MLFREGLELPCFASYPLLRDAAGVEALRRYYRGYLEIARRHGTGFVLDTPTWRANADWGEQLGDDAAALATVNREAVALAEEIRTAEEGPELPIAICGTIGPRGDGYLPGELMSAGEAESYHRAQIQTFAEAGTDLVAVYTLCYAEEAIGIVRAAVAAGLPVAISFTLETDGRLPSGQSLPSRDRAGRRRDRRRRRLLHGQLRPSHPLRRGARGGRRVASPTRRHPCQRLAQEPRRARRGAGPRRGRPGSSSAPNTGR